MKVLITILVLFLLFCAGLCYACCLIAADADERAEEMYQKYKNEQRKNLKNF